MKWENIFRNTKKKSFTLFIGGMNDIRSQFLMGLWKQCQTQFPKAEIMYREWSDVGESVLLLEERKDKKVNIIGHSWGADVGINYILPKLSYTIDTFISLDPVGRKGVFDAKQLSLGFRSFIPSLEKSAPQSKIKAKLWLNSYINYKYAPLTLQNITALLGGAWEYAKYAHVNVDAMKYFGKKTAKGRIIDHGSTYELINALNFADYSGVKK